MSNPRTRPALPQGAPGCLHSHHRGLLTQAWEAAGLLQLLQARARLAAEAPGALWPRTAPFPPPSFHSFLFHRQQAVWLLEAAVKLVGLPDCSGASGTRSGGPARPAHPLLLLPLPPGPGLPAPSAAWPAGGPRLPPRRASSEVKIKARGLAAAKSRLSSPAPHPSKGLRGTRVLPSLLPAGPSQEDAGVSPGGGPVSC